MKNFWWLLKAGYLILLIAMPGLSGAEIGEYTSLGNGRYLTEPERREFLERLPVTGSKVAKEKYKEAMESITLSTGTDPSADVMEFTKLDWLLGVAKKPVKEGYRIFLICFNCAENVPPQELVGRMSAVRYNIWGVSGHFIVLEKHLKSENWDVLYYGGAD